MAVLSPKFKPTTRVSPNDTGVVTGESDGKDAGASKPQLADKPMFIYVTDGSEDGGFDKIEKVILDDNKILIGMWAFTCLKMSPDDVQNDPLLSGKAKADRYFMFVSRDYEKITVLEGSKLKTKNVQKAMEKHAKRDYKTNLKKVIKDVSKLLLEFDKINDARKTLKQKKERLGSDAKQAELKKIDKELADLEEQQKKADEKKAKLLKFELKEAA